MKNILKAIGNAFKGFFVSFLNDIKKDFKKHWLKYIGYGVSFLVPLVFLIVTYLEKKPESWSLPVFVWIPIIMFVLVYWFKLRTYLSIKVKSMQVRNDLEKGKHAGAIIICKTIQVTMTIIPFLICFYVFKSLSELSVRIENIFLLLTICEAVGGLLIIIDTIANVIDYSDK